MPVPSQPVLSFALFVRLKKKKMKVIEHIPEYEPKMQKDVVAFSLGNCSHLDLKIIHVF